MRQAHIVQSEVERRLTDCRRLVCACRSSGRQEDGMEREIECLRTKLVRKVCMRCDTADEVSLLSTYCKHCNHAMGLRVLTEAEMDARERRIL